MTRYDRSDLSNASGHWISQPWGSHSDFNLNKRVSKNENNTKTLRLKGSSENWREIVEIENLEEIHLCNPSHDQISLIANLKDIKRLKIRSFRPKDISFLKNLTDLEELSLDAVSGFESLEPIRALSKLRALNIRMLRRVKDFAPLSPLKELRFLNISGNFDFHQPIESLAFFEGLKNLEFLIFDYVRILEKVRPAFPLRFLNNLKYIKVPRNTFSLEEFGYVAEALKGVEGAELQPVIKKIYFSHGNQGWTEYVAWQTPDEKIDHIDMHRPLTPAIKMPSGAILALGRLTDIGEPSSKTGHLELLGRGSRGFSSKNKNTTKRCLAHIEKYELAKTNARKLLTSLKDI